MSILDLFRLDGSIAVVTGAGKGIGRGIALALAEAGADVVAVARTESDLRETAALLHARGRQPATLAIDVTDEGAMDSIADFAVSTFGKLSIWVNNAGGLPDATPRTLRKTPRESWDSQFALNLTAPWLGCIAAAARMTEGSIINISSRGSFGGHPKNGPYTTAKAGLNSLTATLSLELAPRIRVNAVAPGGVMTDNLRESLDNGVPEAARADYLKTLIPPLGRMGSPEDIGAAVVYLASPAAAWVTGACLHVNGGAGADI